MQTSLAVLIDVGNTQHGSLSFFIQFLPLPPGGLIV
jgi:hypothetical protein